MEQNYYTDSSITGTINTNGTVKRVYNSDALAQAFKIWLTSGKSEKLRTISGGWLIPFLGKTMTDERANNIKKKLIEGLDKEFKPKITVTDLQVIPNYNKNYYIIYLQGYNPELNIGINTYAYVNNNLTI